MIVPRAAKCQSCKLLLNPLLRSPACAVNRGTFLEIPDIYLSLLEEMQRRACMCLCCPGMVDLHFRPSCCSAAAMLRTLSRCLCLQPTGTGEFPTLTDCPLLPSSLHMGPVSSHEFFVAACDLDHAVCRPSAIFARLHSDCDHSATRILPPRPSSTK